MKKNPTVNLISVQELKKIYDKKTDLYLIDVRELEEWQTEHIPRAHHIPKGELVAAIQESVPERSKPLFVHCRAGVRSLHAANCLIELGYQEVYSVEGGIMAWAEAGYPTDVAIDGKFQYRDNSHHPDNIG